MNNVVACNQCGQDYDPNGWLRGLCPACLFARAFPDDELDSTITASSLARSLPFVPPKINELASHFPQLDIRELAGHGGMSAVYRAHHTTLGRMVALKVLPKEIADTHGGAERFQREAQTLAKLSHPNVVEVYDAGQSGPWCYIVMEFVQGPNLRQLLGDSRLASADVFDIVSGICDALQYAHDQGVVHRDVKPENVLIDADGCVKLVDFGLAKLMNPPRSVTAVTRTHQVMGTPHYLAPEQVETPTDVDHRADLYSLGVMMYEMLTGELPLGHFEPPSQRIGSDPALDAVVLKALSKDPPRRYQQARDLQAGMRSPRVAKPSAAATRGRPLWQRIVNELFLSTCSLVAAFLGFVMLVGMGAESKLETPSSTPVSVDSRPTMLNVMSVLPFFISFLLARINVSSAAYWRDLSPIQYLCLPVLVTSYFLLGVSLLIAPGLIIFFLGSLPLYGDFEQWGLLGKVFTEPDRASLLTPYWFRVYGVGSLLSAMWCVFLDAVIRRRPELAQLLFHPVDESTAGSVARTATQCAAALLGLSGLVLSYASWN